MIIVKVNKVYLDDSDLRSGINHSMVYLRTAKKFYLFNTKAQKAINDSDLAFFRSVHDPETEVIKNRYGVL